MVSGLNNLKSLFHSLFNELPNIVPVAGGGSTRKYYRLSYGDLNAVGVIGEDINENKIFLSLCDSLLKEGIKVPKIYAVSDDFSSYILEDLGDVSLFSLLNGEERMENARKAIKNLIDIQTLPENIWKSKVGFPEFSERLVRWDLNYFKYDFLKPSGILFDEERLEDDFDRLTRKLTKESMVVGLMYRDFQSRNILVKGNDLWFIDFQGARKGPLVYDAASFIWQAKAPFSFSEREELGEYYCKLLGESLGCRADEIEKQLNLMIVFRTLQVLGAYGFRGLIQKKAHFIESIPFAIENLSYLKEKKLLIEFPELGRIADELKKLYKRTQKNEEGILVISVFSFSYKQGYPQDLSGNGGGFMFDCRAIHNPGRYDEYKKLTGMDLPVIEFLEKTPEASKFIEDAINMVVPSIEIYLKRGFTSLQIGFGCTGGQHRSVYCAEQFARIISRKYPQIKVVLIHREQGGERRLYN